MLAYTGMSVMLKTHDGAEYMKHWDRSPPAIGSAEEVRPYAAFFESRGVQFHAWAVVQGLDPIREARICSDVLANGARSLTLDLEPRDGSDFWQAGTEEARAFGQELRRLRPSSWISVAPDPRPWQLEAVPMKEFAAIANEIAPQVYWNMFQNEATRGLYAERARFVDRADMTPEWFLDQTYRDLARYRLPIRPVGPGNSPAAEWRRFIAHSQRLQMPSTSVWRHGTASTEVFNVFREMGGDVPRSATLGASSKATPPATTSSDASADAWQRLLSSTWQPLR